jgi:hypothetical protein
LKELPGCSYTLWSDKYLIFFLNFKTWNTNKIHYRDIAIKTYLLKLTKWTQLENSSQPKLKKTN